MPKNIKRLRQARRATKKLKRLLPTRKVMVAKLDALCSVIVRIRDKKAFGGTCPLCIMRPIQVCFHLMRRGMYSTRWDLDNLIGTCAPCNFRHERFPEYATRWFIAMRGAPAYEALHKKAHSLAKFDISELKKAAGQ